MSDKQSTEMKAIRWLLHGETGMSSKSILSEILGLYPSTGRYENHPRDPADLKRCVQLLDEVPELRGALDAMRKLSSPWKRLIDNWTLLEETLKFEMRNSKDGKAPLTYDLMKKLIDGEAR